MNALDNLTVCITNFKRPNYLDRTLASLHRAGVRRVVIASICGDGDVEAIIRRHRYAGNNWLSFDVARLPVDIGCNNTWMLAAYHSRTERIIIMHDDDTLDEAFGKAYVETIGPALDTGKVGFASWRASLLYDDGKTAPTEYWSGPTRILPARSLLKVVAARQRLSLSPIISVFDRATVIQACKEAEQTLTDQACLHHPGMLLGTEILVYMRNIERRPQWLYVDQVLSHYGSHPGSGTIEAQKGGQETLKALFRGYDIARTQGGRAKPVPLPKILLVTSGEDRHPSWNFHFNQFDVLDFTHLKGVGVGPDTDLLRIARTYALPEDIVFFIGSDVGLTTTTPERLVKALYGKEAVRCPVRRVHPEPGRMYKHLANCRKDDTPGGVAFVAANGAFSVNHEADHICYR